MGTGLFGIRPGGQDTVDVAAEVVGKQTVWIPAAAMEPSTTNGCSALTKVEIAVNQPNIVVLDFIGTGAQETCEFFFAFPKSWNLGTISYQVFWTTSAVDTDAVVWRLQGVSVADNGAIGVSHGGLVNVTDAAQGAANELLVSGESAALTIGGSPADDELVFFRFLRNSGDAADTMTEDARLIGIKLFFTTDAVNDD